MWHRISSSSLRSGHHVTRNINSPCLRVSLGLCYLQCAVHVAFLATPCPFEIGGGSLSRRREVRAAVSSSQSAHRTFWQGRKRMAWEEIGSFHIQREELCFHQGSQQVQRQRHSWLCPFVSGCRWGWDRLGPGTLCFSACTWTHVSSGNRIQRSYKGLKITACMRSWGKFWTRYKKTKNPTAASEEPGAKAGYSACPLHSTPPKGWADHLRPPSSPSLWTRPYPHPI